MISSDVYRGLAPEFPVETLNWVAAWMDLLLAPLGTEIVYPQYQIDNTADRYDFNGTIDNRPADLPMAAKPEDFFRAAHAVSGQNAQAFADAYAVLANAASDVQNLKLYNGQPQQRSPSAGPDGGSGGSGGGAQGDVETVGQFQGVMRRMFEHWTGDAAEACERYVDALDDVITTLVQQGQRIAVLVSLYWAAILQTRQSLSEMMTDFCSKMHTKEIGDAVNADKLGVTDVGAVFAAGVAALSLGSGAGAVAIALYLAGQVNTYTTNNKQRDLSWAGTTYSQIAGDYLKSISEEIRTLHDHIQRDIIDHCAEIKNELGNSRVLIDKRDRSFDSNHSNFEPAN